MHPNEFHNRIDQERLVAALADFERHTRCKAFVYVSHRAVEEVMEAARKRFARIHPDHHQPPAVLIYLVPRTQKFAILGDARIHERCGDILWERLAEALGRDLKAGDVTAALLNAVSSLKVTLEEHFPARVQAGD
ncbi:MAG TPA: TPM domain-containing protein [Chthoniobacteraceae bacterium]|jgi:uncharacterized membrane protein|nr:TPM domain-containing protein [Chthoniobacteraceae bacterium]